MQVLQNARRAAVQVVRVGHSIDGGTSTGILDQCCASALTSSRYSFQDSQVPSSLLLRGFSADSAEATPSASSAVASDQDTAGEQGASSSTAASGIGASEELYYGVSIPKHLNANQRFNFRRKIRNNVKEGLKARESLAAAGAPETAAAAPQEELPQNTKAIQHQKEYIARLEDAKQRDRDASARKAAMEQQAETKEAHPKSDTSAEAATAPSTAESKAQPAAQPSQASVSAASSASSEPSTEPSAPNWRVQQKQWAASQTPTATTSSAGIDLLQASQQAQSEQNRRPGFQGKVPGRARRQTPYEPPPTPQAESQEQLEPELSEEEKQQKEEALLAAIRKAMYIDKAAKELTEQNEGQYYPLNAPSVPEAFQDFYKDTTTEKGGCKGLQDEASYTRSNLVLYRGCMHSLHSKVQEQSHKKIHLTGPRGCGKSLALTSLVDWARSQGWLVLYVPSAQRLIEGGTFQKGQDGLWETPEVARDLLRSMLASHRGQLADCTTSSGTTLLQLVEDGMNGSKPGDITAAAANLIAEMANIEQIPTLIAVDDYNVLYSHANYHEWMNEVYRRQLQPHELRLALAFRLFERQKPKNGMFVCASTLGGPVSPRLRVPGPHHSHSIPKFSIAEAAAQLCHYSHQGISAQSLDWWAIQMAYFQADGIPRELRLWRGRMVSVPSPTMLTMLEDGTEYEFEPDTEHTQQQLQSQQVSA